MGDGEAAWNCIPLDQVKHDAATPQQVKCADARAARGPLSLKRMEMRRRKLRSYFHAPAQDGTEGIDVLHSWLVLGQAPQANLADEPIDESCLRLSSGDQEDNDENVDREDESDSDSDASWGEDWPFCII